MGLLCLPVFINVIIHFWKVELPLWEEDFNKNIKRLEGLATSVSMVILIPIYFHCHLEEQISTRKLSFEPCIQSCIIFRPSLFFFFFFVRIILIFMTLGWMSKYSPLKSSIKVVVSSYTLLSLNICI